MRRIDEHSPVFPFVPALPAFQFHVITSATPMADIIFNTTTTAATAIQSPHSYSSNTSLRFAKPWSSIANTCWKQSAW